MKTISAALQAHLDGDTTLAELIKITRADGIVKAFTTFDRDLTVDGLVYKADGSFTVEALDNDAVLKANDYKVTGLLDSTLIDEADLKNGLYDHARIDVYLCNWADPSQGVAQLRRGWIGEVVLSSGKYIADFRGLHDLLQRKVGDIFTPECRHDLGDAKCQATDVSYTGAVTNTFDSATFEDTACSHSDNAFAYGKLTWNSGVNAGLGMEVKSWNATTRRFVLWLPMPNVIATGDTFTVTQGCDKRFSTCIEKFSNAANFGGFPHLPGLAKILEYPESS